jgi:hypothetical protein
MFQYAFEDFLLCPWTFIKTLLFCPISVNPVFNATEKHFHENGLWANPAAKQAPKDDGEENDKHDTHNHQNGK